MPFAPAFFETMRICNYCRRIFFGLMLLDDGAVRLAMDNATADFSDANLKKKKSVYPVKAMRRYTQAVGIISSRLGRSWTAVDRARAIGTVVCLAFYDMRVRNARRWAMHMNGVQMLIEDAGGLDCLEALQGLRQALFMFVPATCVDIY